MIILPRQARDKHRESTQNGDAFLADFRLTPLNKERHFVAHSLICACFELGNAPQRDYGVDPAQEVSKNALFCRQCVYTKTINLSRQARDRHRETLKRRGVFLAGGG
jgi:hypothetical protein